MIYLFYIKQITLSLNYNIILNQMIATSLLIWLAISSATAGPMLTLHGRWMLLKPLAREGMGMKSCATRECYNSSHEITNYWFCYLRKLSSTSQNLASWLVKSPSNCITFVTCWALQKVIQPCPNILNGSLKVLKTVIWYSLVPTYWMAV